MTAGLFDAAKQLCRAEIHVLGEVSGVHFVAEVSKGGSVEIERCIFCQGKCNGS